MEQIKDSLTELSIVIPIAPNPHVETYIEKEIRSWSLSDSAILISGASLDQKYDAFRASSAAVCTSGSAVMELQLAGLPCVVAYRAHLLTEWIIRLRTKLQFISLPNILLDSSIIPEVLFQECTSKNLVAILRKLIFDEDAGQQQIASVGKLLDLLSIPLGGHMSTDSCCPSMIAASAILQAERRR